MDFCLNLQRPLITLKASFAMLIAFGIALWFNFQLRNFLSALLKHTCTSHKDMERKKIFPPPKKFPKIFPPRFEGLSLWWFSTPHLEFWADFPPSYEFWHQNPQGKHQNSLKSGKEKFSTPLKISWKFSLWKIFPPNSTTCLSMYASASITN